MISKTKIKQRKKRKTDQYIVETLNELNKHKGWKKAAQAISSGRRQYSSINLGDIDKETKEGDTVIVLGKVLGSGDLNKRVRVCALNFSESAHSKMKRAKAEAVTIIDEVKKNPKAEGVKVLR